MIFCNKRSFIFLSFFVLSYAVFSGEIFAQHVNSPGKQSFEQAYALEDQEPEKAAELYEQALNEGLDQKLHSAARWRMFYLYRRLKKHSKAYSMLDSFGSSSRLKQVREGLLRDMQKDWRIDQKAVELYISGLDFLKDKKTGDAETSFENALSRAPANSMFRREVVERLSDAGLQSSAARIASRSGGNAPSEDLLQADLHYSKGDLEESRRIVMEVAEGDAYLLKPVDRHHALYLMGRISRSEKKVENAISYFRTAARYASGEEKNRLNALAAFSLYKEGYPGQALSLVDRIPSSSDQNVLLLQNILRVEVRKDASALAFLRLQKGELEKESRSGNGGFLVDRALAILRGKPGKVKP